jgi:hypothetical protein
MKRPLLILLLLISGTFILSQQAFAQTDTLRNNKADTVKVNVQHSDPEAKADEEFNLLLLSLALIFAATVIGTAIAGTVVMVLFLLIVFALMAAGILSISVVAGFYRRSFQFGFKTFVIIISTLAGIIIGGFGLLIISRLLESDMTIQRALITGGLGGALGGILMGQLVYQALKQSAIYFWKKYHQYKKGPLPDHTKL